MSNRETPAQLERGKPIRRKALFLRAMDVLLRETGAILSRENGQVLHINLPAKAGLQTSKEASAWES